MGDADSNQTVRRSGLPSLIPGVYNYCDSRCAKCPFNQRCLTNLARERLDRSDPGLDVFEEILREREGDPPEPPPEVREAIDEMNERLRAMTPEELEEAGREHDAHVDRVKADRLVLAARQYVLTAWNVTQALEPIVTERGDPVVIEAVETIAELAGPVSSKTYRAVSGSMYEDFDKFDLEHDANGSAKVARLAIAESRRAWSVLMEIGRAMADGVPPSMLRVLDEIDAGLAASFPRAMAFVRPGFDTEGPAP
jgi:hypothetical protein